MAFEVPGSFVPLGLMRSTTLANTGKEYAVSSAGSAGRTGAAYNLTAIAVALMASWLYVRDAWASRPLAVFVAGSFVIGAAVDPEPLARKFSVTDLLPQLVAFAELTVRWLKDTGGFFALTFATFICLASSGHGSALWHPLAFWIAYLAWISVRFVYFGIHMWDLRRRWARMAPPFVIHKANFRSPERTARHMVWSLFMGHVGLAFRCGRQLALIAVYSALAGPLPSELGRRVPHLWALGLVGLCALFYLYGTAVGPIYYKVHRTLHNSGRLYAGLHKVHHKATIPTLLDSGTECAFELALVEYTGCVHLLWPSWAFTATEMLFATGQAASHHTLTAKLGKGGHDGHVAHHRVVSFNYACSIQEPLETKYVPPAQRQPASNLR